MRTLLTALIVAGTCFVVSAAAGESKTRPLPVKGLNETLDGIVVNQEAKAKAVDELTGAAKK